MSIHYDFGGSDMTERSQYKESIDRWVDEHKEEMIEDLKSLIRIPSVRGEASEGEPYGKMCAKALSAMQGLMEKYGLRAENYENYCVTGDMDGEGEKKLDILAHLDVVPVSDAWKKTKPFEPLVEGDRIYGRGSIDDKGPAIAALYAMRCLKELGISLSHGVRLICGSDEECGSSDLDYYYSKEAEAEYTFSPDADYPLINIELGRLSKEFSAQGELNIPVSSQENRNDPAGSQENRTVSNSSQENRTVSGSSQENRDASLETARKKGGVRVRKVQVGHTSNVIPGSGEVILQGVSDSDLEDAIRQTKEAAGGTFTFERSGDETVVSVTGQTGHAAFPDRGNNSVTLILELLKHLPLADDAGERMLLKAGRLWPHGDYYGASLGVDCSDEKSGKLTMSFTVLNYDVAEDGTSYSMRGVFDCRAPICCNDENLTRKMKEVLESEGFEMEDGPMVLPHYVSADSELVQKLLASYELYFGEKGEPRAIGGGTYVHRLQRGVAFGCSVDEVDNHMHGEDEFMEISMLIRSTRIFADAIVRLCG